MTHESRLTGWMSRNESRIKSARIALSYLVRNPATLFAMIIMVGWVIIAMFAPLIAPYPAVYTDMSHRLLPPSPQHWFGTDDVGRDVFSRGIYASQIDLVVAIAVIAIAYSISVPLGCAAGYYGGRLDEVVMRVTDMFLALPSIILAMAIAAALGPSFTNTVIALAVSWWPWNTRVGRSRVLSIKESQYISASKSIGASNSRIIFLHLIPNTASPIIVQATTDLGWTILAASALGFLGIGIQAPTAEWGLMISLGRIYALSQWWIPTMPGIAISLVVFASNLLGDGLRDILDPKFRGLR